MSAKLSQSSEINNGHCLGNSQKHIYHDFPIDSQRTAILSNNALFVFVCSSLGGINISLQGGARDSFSSIENTKMSMLCFSLVEEELTPQISFMFRHASFSHFLILKVLTSQNVSRTLKSLD